MKSREKYLYDFLKVKKNFLRRCDVLVSTATGQFPFSLPQPQERKNTWLCTRKNYLYFLTKRYENCNF